MPVNDNQEIEAAYAEAVKALFRVLYASYSTADGNKQVEKKADEAFKAGLAIARRTRDRALAML